MKWFLIILLLAIPVAIREIWLAKYICDHLLGVFDPSGDHC